MLEINKQQGKCEQEKKKKIPTLQDYDNMPKKSNYILLLCLWLFIRNVLRQLGVLKVPLAQFLLRNSVVHKLLTGNTSNHCALSQGRISLITSCILH